MLPVYVFSCQTEETPLVTRQPTQEDLEDLDLNQLDSVQHCDDGDVLSQ